MSGAEKGTTRIPKKGCRSQRTSCNFCLIADIPTSDLSFGKTEPNNGETSRNEPSHFAPRTIKYTLEIRSARVHI